MSESQYKPFAEMKVKVREYKDKETGKMKGVWITIGTIFSTPHGSSMFGALESIPVTSLDRDGNRVPFDGKFSVFKREDFDGQQEATTADDLVTNKDSKDVIIEDIDDKPIDLSEIPF